MAPIISTLATLGLFASSALANKADCEIFCFTKSQKGSKPPSHPTLFPVPHQVSYSWTHTPFKNTEISYTTYNGAVYTTTIVDVENFVWVATTEDIGPKPTPEYETYGAHKGIIGRRDETHLGTTDSAFELWETSSMVGESVTAAAATTTSSKKHKHHSTHSVTDEMSSLVQGLDLAMATGPSTFSTAVVSGQILQTPATTAPAFLT